MKVDKLKVEIEEISEEIARLDRAFNLYFAGYERVAPMQRFNAMKRDIRALNEKIDSMQTTSAQRFLVASLLGRFSSYRNKWERGLREIEEGRVKPGSEFFGGIGKDPALLAGEGTGNDKEKEDFVLAEEDTDSLLDSAAERYVTLARAHLGKSFDKNAIRGTLESKMTEVRAKYGNDVAFDVYFDGEKVRVRPVSAKK